MEITKNNTHQKHCIILPDKPVVFCVIFSDSKNSTCFIPKNVVDLYAALDLLRYYTTISIGLTCIGRCGVSNNVSITW